MSRKKQAYLIVLGALVVLGILIGGVILPLFKKVRNSGEEIKNQKALLAFMGEQKGYYYKLSNDYEGLKNELGSLPAPFLEAEPTKAVHFIELLEGVAGAYNLQLEFMGFSKGEGTSEKYLKDIKAAAAELLSAKTEVDSGAEKKPVTKEEKSKKEILPFLVYKIKVQGGFTDIIKFLIHLENLQYHSQAGSIKMRIIKIKEARREEEPREEIAGEIGEGVEEKTSIEVEKIEADIEGQVYLDPTSINKGNED